MFFCRSRKIQPLDVDQQPQSVQSITSPKDEWLKNSLTCPVTFYLFKEPVLLIGSGITLEKEAAITILESSKKCPKTRKAITGFTTNSSMVAIVDYFLEAHPEERENQYVPGSSRIRFIGNSRENRAVPLPMVVVINLKRTTYNENPCPGRIIAPSWSDGVYAGLYNNFNYFEDFIDVVLDKNLRYPDWGTYARRINNVYYTLGNNFDYGPPEINFLLYSHISMDKLKNYMKRGAQYLKSRTENTFIISYDYTEEGLRPSLVPYDETILTTMFNEKRAPFFVSKIDAHTISGMLFEKIVETRASLRETYISQCSIM